MFTDKQKQVWSLFNFFKIIISMKDEGVLLIAGICFQSEMETKMDSCCYNACFIFKDSFLLLFSFGCLSNKCRASTKVITLNRKWLWATASWGCF